MKGLELLFAPEIQIAANSRVLETVADNDNVLMFMWSGQEPRFKTSRDTSIPSNGISYVMTLGKDHPLQVSENI